MNTSSPIDKLQNEPQSIAYNLEIPISFLYNNTSSPCTLGSFVEYSQSPQLFLDLTNTSYQKEIELNELSKQLTDKNDQIKQIEKEIQESEKQIKEYTMKLKEKDANLNYYESLEITNETSNSYYKYCVSKLEKNQNQLFYKINKMEVVKLDKLKSYYKGKLIFITDRNTASASENLIYLAKVTLGNEKVIVIGENSLGCFEYVTVFSYLLPNSRLSINLSSRRNSMLNLFPQWHGDCYGIYPDYWSIGNDLNETIFLVTKDNEMKLKLSDIANRLM